MGLKTEGDVTRGPHDLHLVDHLDGLFATTLLHDMESAGIEIVNTICDLRDAPSDIIAMRPDKPEDGANLGALADAGASKTPDDSNVKDS